MKQLFALILASLGLALSVSAQKAAISGTILDESNGEPLIGANIVIEGTSVGTATDFDGKYQFQAEPGTYNLLVTYIGYNEKLIEGVEFKGDETTYLDVSLSDNTVNLLGEGEAVVVTATAIERTANAVLMLQKRSDKIQDGISSQEISQLGVGNAAGALQKVTGTTIVDGKYVFVRGLGDRYSATTINDVPLPSIDPYRNSAQLDLIPSNFVDNIIAAKTFTPDLPGNFTGGSVNIQTKSLPERFVYNISLSTSYNDQASLVDDFLTFNAGNQAWLGFNDGTLDKPAILDDPTIADVVRNPSSAALARTNDEIANQVDQAIRSVNTQMAPTMQSTPLNYGISADIGNQFMLAGKPLGVQLGINYSRNYSFYNDGLQANYILGGGSANQLIENFNLEERNATETPQLSGLASLGYKFSPNNEIKFIALYSHSTEIQSLFLEGIYADYDILEPELFQSRSLSFQERQLNDYILSGEHRLGASGIRIEWAGSYIKTQQLEPDLRFFANDYDTEDDQYSISAPGNYSFPGHFYRDLTDDEFLGKLDITIPFLQSANTGNKIKFGGFYRTKERDFNESIYNVLRRQGEVYTGDADAYFGKENIGLIEEDAQGRNIIGLYLQDQSRASNSYVGEQDIYAGYGMVTVNLLPNLKVITGGRLEGTYFYVESGAFDLSPNPEDEVAEIDELDFLPAVHVIYNVTDNANVRASYSNTIARPNMREIAPFGSFGFIGDPLVFGNPDLVRTRINNFDLRYELYPAERSGELFAVSAFYKSFQDPIVRTFRPAGNPQFTWKNVENATLYGGEIEYRKNLDVISPTFSNFNFSANFAYIYSVSDIDSAEYALITDVDPDAPSTRPFAGQSEFVANANLSYGSQEKGWDAIIAFNFFSDRLSETGIQGTPDIYERGRATLDFSISKEVGNLKFSFRARNLLDPDFERYNTFLDQDYIYSRYQRGRTLSFGISYGI